MVDSGIKCDSACNGIFGELEKKNLEYVIMVIEKVGGTDKVVVKEQSPKGESDKIVAESGEDTKGATPVWHRFSKAIQQYPIAYGSCYVTFKSKDEREVTKLPFIFWCTEGCKVNQKMVYSSTKIPTSRKIKSINCTIQCADSDELSFKEIVQKVSKGDNK